MPERNLKYGIFAAGFIAALILLTAGLSGNTATPQKFCTALGSTSRVRNIKVLGEVSRSLNEAENSALRRCTDLGYLKCHIQRCGAEAN